MRLGLEGAKADGDFNDTDYGCRRSAIVFGVCGH